MVFFTATYANAAKTTPINTVTTSLEIAKYQIDLGDITNKSNQEIKELISAAFEKIQDSDLECEVTIKGTVRAFFLSVDISVTVKGPCNEMIEKGINVSGLVWAAVKAKLTSF